MDEIEILKKVVNVLDNISPVDAFELMGDELANQVVFTISMKDSNYACWHSDYWDENNPIPKELLDKMRRARFADDKFDVQWFDDNPSAVMQTPFVLTTNSTAERRKASASGE